MSNDPTFTSGQAVAATEAMRRRLGKAPEQFSAEQFVGMISDEVEALRASGMSDAEISTLLKTSANVEVDPALIGRFYASPELRRRS